MAQKKEALREIDVTVSNKVLVLGNGLLARSLADQLTLNGHEVILCDAGIAPGVDGGFWGRDAEGTALPEVTADAVAQNPAVERLEAAALTEFSGFPGQFRARFRLRDGAYAEREFGAGVLAVDCETVAPLEGWGLGLSERIKTLSSVAGPSGMAGLPGEEAATYVLACGFGHDSFPFSQQVAIETALRLAANPQAQIVFLVEHFKVAGTGMERLYREARNAGVLFVKLTDERPRIVESGDKVAVTYPDDTLGAEVSLEADWVILEDAFVPWSGTAEAAEIMRLNLDASGFFQGDNVYNLPVFTNRTGIWVVGSAKGPTAPGEGLEEARAVVADIGQLLKEGARRVAENRIQLDTKRCTICLTCYRLCPHRAISYLNRRPVFNDIACRGCGICAAECPMDAIQLFYFHDDDLKGAIQTKVKAAAEAGGLKILAFCCQNSALDAADLARRNGLELPGGLELLKVPCAGRVDPDYLLSAFRAGADGVMVLACHDESCKSVNGSNMAAWRVEYLGNTLEAIGLPKERLFFGNIAPGMAFDFVNTVRQFEKDLLALADKGEAAAQEA